MKITEQARISIGGVPLRKVMVSGCDYTDSDHPTLMERGQAWFHAFSTDSCVEHGTIQVWPIAIVEWPDGQVETVYAELIQFLD